MYLGQVINYLNRRTVSRFMVTAQHSIPEIGLKEGKFKVFNLYDVELSRDILKREVTSIDCINNIINFDIE